MRMKRRLNPWRVCMRMRIEERKEDKCSEGFALVGVVSELREACRWNKVEQISL